jgi:hypothetical protein
MLTIIYWLIYIGFLGFLIVFGYSLTLSLINKTPYLPSKKKTLKVVLDSLEFLPSDKVIDLGCGDMKMLIMLEKKFNIKGTGYEISPLPYLFAKSKLLVFNCKSKIIFQNILKHKIPPADKIFIYLTPTILKKLAPKLKSECKKNTLIISNTFTIPNLKLLKEIPATKANQKIYVYKV